MVQIDLVYEGGLRCAATHGPSSTTLVTDAPVDNHGKGQSFSPTDLVATALGTCMVTLMGIAAEHRGWDLEGTRCAVTKHMVADPDRRIGRLEVRISVPGDFDEDARRVLERAAHGCPVKRSLRPEVDVPVRFEWGTRQPTGEAGSRRA